MSVQSVSKLRERLLAESAQLNVCRADVLQAQEDLAEAEARFRAQRTRVSNTIEEVGMAERGILLGDTH